MVIVCCSFIQKIIELRSMIFFRYFALFDLKIVLFIFAKTKKDNHEQRT